MYKKREKVCEYAYIMAQSISILDIGSIVFGETEELIDFLQQHLLFSNMVCGSCNTPMTLRQKLDISNGYLSLWLM